MTTAPFLDLLAMSEFIAIERGTRRCAYAHANLFQSCLTLCDLVACQASLSLEFSRQEYWSGLPCPLPWDLPDPGIEPTSLAGGFFTTEPWKKPTGTHGENHWNVPGCRSKSVAFLP